MPHTVLLPVWDRNPQARPQKVRNDGAVNNGANQASRLASEAGTGSVTSPASPGILARRGSLASVHQVRFRGPLFSTMDLYDGA